MNWEWIGKFIWILFIEYIQNLPIIVGIVLGLSELKKGLPWWKVLLVMVGSSLLCGFIITSTEWIKVLPTTLDARPFTILNSLRLGAIFSAACAILLVYMALTAKLKLPYVADWVFGVILGGATALSESMVDTPSLLTVLHALGFMVASGSLVTLIRYSSGAPTRNALFMRIGFITLLMTLLIAVFDYLPFIQGASIAYLIDVLLKA